MGREVIMTVITAMLVLSTLTAAPHALKKPDNHETGHNGDRPHKNHDHATPPDDRHSHEFRSDEDNNNGIFADGRRSSHPGLVGSVLVTWTWIGD